MSTTCRLFPEVFKREAVDRVISSGLLVGKVATELRLNDRIFEVLHGRGPLLQRLTSLYHPLSGPSEGHLATASN
jgi:hypothetical protein